MLILYCCLADGRLARRLPGRRGLHRLGNARIDLQGQQQSLRKPQKSPLAPIGPRKAT